MDDAASRLLRTVEQYGSALVAYSGGVDSTLVAVAAWKVFGGSKMMAVTGDSPSVAKRELTLAEAVAHKVGFPWTSVATHELEDPRYQTNDRSRCYFCKSELYGVLESLRSQSGYQVVMDGFNRDDVGDFRPGLRAGQEHRVVSPLKAAELGKNAIRELSRVWGLPNWNKPASPCLSSRIPYQTPVTVERLRSVEAAEDALHDLGFNAVRVRHHEHAARIEVPPEEFPRILAQRESIVKALKQVGYTFVSLDLAGFHSGSLNTLLSHTEVTPKG